MRKAKVAMKNLKFLLSLNQENTYYLEIGVRNPENNFNHIKADRDIEHAFNYIKDDGFIVLHDCYPPTEWHARESYRYINTPAGEIWNGTTWKAFLKWRFNASINSCCIDSDW
jgi:hypothetical protein